MAPVDSCDFAAASFESLYGEHRRVCQVAELVRKNSKAFVDRAFVRISDNPISFARVTPQLHRRSRYRDIYSMSGIHD